MGRPIGCYGPIADIGVAVAAAVRAGIVGANINTHAATATRPLPFIFGQPDGLSQDRSQQTVVDTSACLDTALLLEKGIAAGFEIDAILSGDGSQLPDKMRFFRVTR